MIGDTIEMAYLTADGAPALTALGYSSYRQKFDDHHNVIEATYFDTGGNPVLTTEKLARRTMVYDAYGNETQRSYFGVDDKPTLIFGGFAGYHQTFDVRRNLVMKAYFGVDGEPIAIADGGYARVTWRYDARDKPVEESYFGVDGKPAHDDGVVAIKYSYDSLGRQTKIIYLDAQDHEFQMELVVNRVSPGGLGALAGLAAGDHILAYNGQVMGSLKQLNSATKPGGMPFRTLTIRRGAQVLNLEVEAGDLTVSIGLARISPGQKENGSPAASGDQAPPGVATEKVKDSGNSGSAQSAGSAH